MRCQIYTFSFCVLGMMVTAAAAEIQTSVDSATVPKAKQTSLGLYLTPGDADKALQADPAILFIDVRDPLEIAFTGHPKQVDAIVPFLLGTYEFDPKTDTYRMVPNEEFVADVNALIAREGMERDHPIIVMCRSGGRSAAAVEQLAKAGYTAVWNLVEGFEGDQDDAGERAVNGWRNSGLPWTYKLTPEKAWTHP